MLEWLNQNMPLIIALGEVGQFLAAIFAAIAAGLSWRAVRVAREGAALAREEAALAREEAALAREEAERSRQSFQFSWEPLLEVTFDSSFR